MEQIVSRMDPQLKVRLPIDLRDWLKRQAAENGRTMNAEIVFALRERQQRANPPGAPKRPQ